MSVVTSAKRETGEKTYSNWELRVGGGAEVMTLDVTMEGRVVDRLPETTFGRTFFPFLLVADSPVYFSSSVLMLEVSSF